MNATAQSLAARLPRRVQQEINRARHGWQIGRHVFVDSDDAYFERLGEVVAPGDFVLDVGANVGHYAIRLAEIVGAAGRVIAMEPVPATFELLTANAQRAPHPNITLLNVAASDRPGMASIDVPAHASGLPNYYQAKLSDSGGMAVLCMCIDALALPGRVSFLKVDAEGHDFAVLRGARELLQRDRPALLIEDGDAEIAAWLAQMGYARDPETVRSPNRLYRVPA